MPDLTAAFQKAYGAINLVGLPAPTSLNLYSEDGGSLGAIAYRDGWTVEELNSENLGGRVVELRVTDRDGIEFADVTFFGYGGYRYERAGFPNPPTGNPREWVWRLIPVGVDE